MSASLLSMLLFVKQILHSAWMLQVFPSPLNSRECFIFYLPAASKEGITFQTTLVVICILWKVDQGKNYSYNARKTHTHPNSPSLDEDFRDQQALIFTSLSIK